MSRITGKKLANKGISAYEYSKLLERKYRGSFKYFRKIKSLRAYSNYVYWREWSKAVIYFSNKRNLSLIDFEKQNNPLGYIPYECRIKSVLNKLGTIFPWMSNEERLEFIEKQKGKYGYNIEVKGRENI